MTASFNVSPKTTKQNLIVRIGKSEAEVTNNKRRHSGYCTVEAIATDKHKASCGLSATAQLLVPICCKVTKKLTNIAAEKVTNIVTQGTRNNTMSAVAASYLVAATLNEF